MYMNFDEKHSPNVLENQTRLQNSTDTTRKSLSFRVLCALFEKNPSGINQIFLKILPEAELKIETKSVLLVIWSRGFPTVCSHCLNIKLDPNKTIIKVLEVLRGVQLDCNHHTFWLWYPFLELPVENYVWPWSREDPGEWSVMILGWAGSGSAVLFG